MHRAIAPSIFYGCAFASASLTSLAQIRGKFSGAIFGRNSQRNHFLEYLVGSRGHFEPYLIVLECRIQCLCRAALRNIASTVRRWTAAIEASKAFGPFAYLKAGGSLSPKSFKTKMNSIFLRWLIGIALRCYVDALMCCRDNWDASLRELLLLQNRNNIFCQAKTPCASVVASRIRSSTGSCIVISKPVQAGYGHGPIADHPCIAIGKRLVQETASHSGLGRQQSCVASEQVLHILSGTCVHVYTHVYRRLARVWFASAVQFVGSYPCR